MFKGGNAAVAGGFHGVLGVFDHFAVFIQSGGGGEYLPHIAAHAAGIHAQAAAYAAGDAIHPFKAGDAVLCSKGGQLLELHAGTGQDGGFVDELQLLEFTAIGVNHGAADTAIAHHEVGATPHYVHGNVAILEVVDHVLHGLHAVRLNPVLGLAAHAEGGVLAHGFVQAGREVAAAFGLHFGENAQVLGNPGAGFMHIACTQGQEKVTRLQLVAHHMVSQRHFREEEGIGRAVLLHGIHDGLAGDAGDGQLAGRVYICHKQFVHAVQHAAEIIAQQLGAGEAVRLEEDDQAIRVQALGCLYCGGDFRGVVTVVVHDAVVLGKVLGLEAAAGAGKGGKAAADAGEVCTHFHGGGSGCQGVEHIVAAGDAQLHAAQFSALVVDGVESAASLHGNIRGGVVCILPAVGNAVGVLAADIGSAGIALAVEYGAAGLAAERVEHLLNVVQVAVEIQVLGLHVQHNAVLGDVVHKRAVRFIAFSNQVIAVGIPVGIGAQHGDFGTHIVAGAQASLAEQVGGEGGGGGLAVSTGYDYALLVVENGCQAFGAAQAQAAQLAGGGECHVILADGAGVNDDFCIGHGISAVGAGEGEAALLQAFRFLAGYTVAAAYAVPHFQEHACDAAHAGTCYTDKMNAHRVVPVQKPFA